MEQFDSYWHKVSDEVATLSDGPVKLEEIPLHTNEVSTTYSAKFFGTGSYPLFAYLTVPRGGKGPFPALLQVPGYGSVVGVPAYERRARYVILNLCHRGQRLSDTLYSAAYPGLLTEGLPDASTYRWKEIAADCLRGLDVLVNHPEADESRLAVAGNDLAAITAALRPNIDYMLVNTLLFRGISDRIADLAGYPSQEFSDYVRYYPDHADQVADTVAMFDPIAFAKNIEAESLVTCIEGQRSLVEPLSNALVGKTELRINTGRGYLDHGYEDNWLAERTSA